MTTESLYKPHARQIERHAARAKGAKTLLDESARRFGKTRLGVGDMLMAYDTVLRMKRAPSMIPPFHAWLVGPDFKQTRQPFHEVLSLIPGRYVQDYSVADQMIWLAGSENWQGRAGLFELRSAYYVEKLQSVGLDHLWITEAQDIPEDAFTKVLPTTRSPGRLGWKFFEGIPGAYPEHWWWRLCEQAERGELTSTAHFRNTAFENPLLTPEDLAGIEEDRNYLSPNAWERMYLARRSTGGGFFRGIDKCIGGDLLSGPVPGRQYVGGFDPGWTTDPSVCVIMDRAARRMVAAFEWDGSHLMKDIAAHLEAIQEEWKMERLPFDASSSGGVAYTEVLMASGLSAIVEPVPITGANRGAMLNSLAGSIDRGTITLPPVRPLIRQMRAMQERKLHNGRWGIAVPQGEHDDYIFALALALTACDESHAVDTGAHIHRRRDVPTQAEANGQRRHGLAHEMIMRRRMDRMLERGERVGVT